jgi:hypothetical protein
MDKINSLIEEAERKGIPLEFYGGKSEQTIGLVESRLQTSFPPSFKSFLRNFGGGGVVGEWISGIYGENPFTIGGGTIYGDTMNFRSSIGLDDRYIVVYSQEDGEVCWGIDTSISNDEGENPVMSIDVFGREEPYKLYDSFEDFFVEYLQLHIEIADEV